MIASPKRLRHPVTIFHPSGGRSTAIYEVHGVDATIGVFPITQIKAASDDEAISKAHWDRHLPGWGCPMRLFEVPYFHTGLRGWHDDEMRFVADIKFSPSK